jgi:hemerythrin superfamily protein
MDVIEVIKKDHRRVEELFSRFRGGGGLTGLVRRVTGDVPTRQRRSAVEGLCRELDVHARLEEEIVYPAARGIGDPELVRLVEESLREHARVKDLVAQLRATGPEDGKTNTRVDALEECVRHHVSEEEGEMLPRLEQIMSERDRAQLGRRMQAGRRSARVSPRRGARRRAGTAARATVRRRVRKSAAGSKQKKRARRVRAR